MTSAALLLNTLLFSGISALLAAPLGLGTTWWVHRNPRTRRLLFPVALALIFLPPYVHVAGWEAALGLQGWLGRWLFPHRPIAFLAGWRGAIFMQTLINVPWIILIVGAAFARLPRQYEELAALSGSPRQVLRYVHWPQLRGVCLAAVLWVFVLSATDITVTDVYQVRTFAEEIYTGFALGDDLASVAQRTLLGSLSTGFLAGLCYLSSRRIRTLFRPAGGRVDAVCIPMRRDWRSRVALSLLVVVGLGVPWSSLLYQAGTIVTTVEATRVRSWSLTKAIGMIVTSPVRFGSEFAWTLALGQLVALTLVPLTLILGWYAHRRVIFRSLLAGTGVVLMAIPAPLLALGVARIVNRPDSDWLFYLYDRTLFVPWLAVGLRLFPLVCFVLLPQLDGIDMRIVDVIRLHGGGRIATFRHAIWPSLKPTLVWLWLVTLAATVADLSAAILAVPPGVATLSIRIFNLVHYGITDQLAGLCLCVMLLFGGITAFVLSYQPSGRNMDRSADA